MRLLLDTNAYSELARGHSTVAGLVREAEALLLSAVVVGELLGGFRRGTRWEENFAGLRRFLAEPQDLYQRVCVHYRRWLVCNND